MRRTSFNTFLDGTIRYRVVVPMVVVDSASQPDAYISRGAFIPADTNPAQIEEMLRIGAIEEFQAVSA